MKSAMTGFLTRLMPGLPALLDYKSSYLRYDLVAGVSVAAVALPVGVAYAELAGFDPVVGLYSSILPLAAYALFGTSRQLIVGPPVILKGSSPVIGRVWAVVRSGIPDCERKTSLKLILIKNPCV